MSNAPTAAREQHAEGIEAPRVDARAFRQGWRVTCRLDALHRDGRITAGEWQAAAEYRAAWDRALSTMRGTSSATRVSGGAGAAADRLASVADTMTRLREVEARIGGFAALLTYRCVVLDRSWADIGRVLCRDPHTAQRWTTDAIRLLARAWRGSRRRRRAGVLNDTGQRPGAF
jgi:hypothetical protein